TTTTDAATCDADSSQAGSIATLQILAASAKQQEQNLKPILKRKDTVERCSILSSLSPQSSSSNLPPPILKKRDSFSDINSSHPSSVAQSTVSNVPNGKLCHNRAPPRQQNCIMTVVLSVYLLSVC